MYSLMNMCSFTNYVRSSIVYKCVPLHHTDKIITANGDGRMSAIATCIHSRTCGHSRTVFTHELCMNMCICRSRRQVHYGKWRRAYVCNHSMYLLMTMSSLTNYVHWQIMFKCVCADRVDKRLLRQMATEVCLQSPHVFTHEHVFIHELCSLINCI